jgi:hypothetical protein
MMIGASHALSSTRFDRTNMISQVNGGSCGRSRNRVQSAWRELWSICSQIAHIATGREKTVNFLRNPEDFEMWSGAMVTIQQKFYSPQNPFRPILISSNARRLPLPACGTFDGIRLLFPDSSGRWPHPTSLTWSDSFNPLHHPLC